MGSREGLSGEWLPTDLLAVQFVAVTYFPYYHVSSTAPVNLLHISMA